MSVPSLSEVLNQFDMEVDLHDQVLAALLARETEACDQLRLAAVQFSMFPQIVAEVLAEVGLGPPMSEEERALVHTQFHNLMEQLQEEFRRRQQGEG